jgi:HAMP domain-containing protein
MQRHKEGKTMSSIPPVPSLTGLSGEGLLPEKIDKRLEHIHEVVKAINAGDYSKNISIPAKYDNFVPFERDMYNLLSQVKDIHKQNEMAISKIKEAISEIIELGNKVKEATESIKAGKFDFPFDTASQISEVRELKKRFQYLISVIRLLSAESELGSK